MLWPEPVRRTPLIPAIVSSRQSQEEPQEPMGRPVAVGVESLRPGQGLQQRTGHTTTRPGFSRWVKRAIYRLPKNALSKIFMEV